MIVRTAFHLGLRNIARVAIYRTLCKFGRGPINIAAHSIPSGSFFAKDQIPPTLLEPVAFDGLQWFGWYVHSQVQPHPPDWFYNPFNGAHFPGIKTPWHHLPDFNPEFGDIKCLWEQSRFHWALWWAQQARASGDILCIDTLNHWIADWVSRNPGYLGPNWKCGQEASFRVMHLYFTSRLLGQHQSMSRPLQAMIVLHLKRIAPTLMYALSQDNNHGTSEAAALFIGGHWLASTAVTCSQAAGWCKKGRQWLEERAARLIMSDGTFSQYSVNYHRVMLDTFCMAELFRRDFGLPAFSSEFYRRVSLATSWLHAVTQPAGDAPNLGANDGAQLLPLSNTDYRDYRPSVQLASILFLDSCAFGAGRWNLSAQWLDVSLPAKMISAPVSRDFDQGGMVFLKNASAALYLRYPRFRFRPSQADIFHLDLWIGDVNVLRDAGSYSYNCQAPWQEYFPGIAAHNTLQFDAREPMPRISRFLYGEWVSTEVLTSICTNETKQSWCGQYKDHMGSVHLRHVEMSDQELCVVDEISMSEPTATLRWRLAPSNWKLSQRKLTSDLLHLDISADDGIESISLVEGWESRYYHQKTPIPVLEIVLSKPGKIQSHFRWHNVQ